MIRGAIILLAGVALIAVGLAFDGSAARLIGYAFIGFGFAKVIMGDRKQ